MSEIEEKDELAKKIFDTMVVDHSDALEKNFGLASKFIKITKEGKVDVIVKSQLTGPEKIAMYLIGKLYAKRAGLTATEYTKNEELMNELGIGYTSLLPWLKTLRDNNIIKAGKSDGRESTHAVLLNAVERMLSNVDKKMKSIDKSSIGETTDGVNIQG